MDKLFVVRKYIVAKSAKDAIRKDRTAPVDEIMIDEDFKSGRIEIGFKSK